MKRLLLAFLFAPFFAVGQTPDSVSKSTVVSEVNIIGSKSDKDIHPLPEVVGTTVYAAKKGNVLVLDNVQGNVVNNNMRQVMAKVPGVFIWESEGSGIQIGISTRGLSPNRSWEFNVRQNGYEIAADPYGYPEAYYNPQLQSVQRIELVRGSGSLQYGAQIGGMVNYILKNGSDFTKPIQVETYQTIGSYGLFDTYNAIGGRKGKFHYYAFADYRRGNGWRQNNAFETFTLSGTVTYNLSSKWAMTAEAMRWTMLSQQPGGLSDSLFNVDPRISLRSRNWFNLIWNTAAFTTDFKPSNKTRITLKLAGIFGDRNSVGFLPSAGILAQDVKNAAGEYANRQIDIDKYRNFSAELRGVHQLSVKKNFWTLTGGLRYYQGNTDRFRNGVGDNGTKFSLAQKEGTLWNGEIAYFSRNAAAFTEMVIRLGKKWNVVPGVRAEYLMAEASGYSGLKNGQPIVLVPQAKGRTFVLGGIGVEYKVNDHSKVYFNTTQSYRPMQFADLTTPPTTDKIDPNLRDSRGLNQDLGIKGTFKNWLNYDLSVYQLFYDNRIGTIRQQLDSVTFYNLKTNVGNSVARGIEVYAEANLLEAFSFKKKDLKLSVFSTYAFNDARYETFRVVTQSGSKLVESSYANKRVEYAPKHLARAGVSGGYKQVLVTVQWSYCGEVYTDANNTEAPTANAQNGKIPAYQVWDFTLSWKHKSGLGLKAGVNNVLNTHYFTRRAGGYPGPGILPADGRTVFATLSFRMK